MPTVGLDPLTQPIWCLGDLALLGAGPVVVKGSEAAACRS
jgi:hypothetical protein